MSLLSSVALKCLCLIGFVHGEKKPNVLFIMTDQHRFDAIGRVQGELSQYHGKLKVRTPNLDRLSRDGVYFRTAYTQCPVCGPARTSLRTGLTIERTGVQTNPLSDAENRRIPKIFQDKIDKIEGLDQILVEDHGYVSEYYGKWHIPDRLHYTRNGSILVVEKNDYSYADSEHNFRLASWDTKLRAFLNHFEKAGYIKKTFAPGQQEDTFSKYPYTPITLDSRFGQETNTPLDGFSTFDQNQNSVMGKYALPKNYTSSYFNHDVAIKALDRLAAQKKPFFLTVSQHLPHPPMMAAHEYLDYYWNRRDELFVSQTVGVPLDDSTSYYSRGEQQDLQAAGYCSEDNVREWTAVYYAMIEELDGLIGIMLNRLEGLGITDNTLVVFTSDHGEMLGSHCRRGKGTFFEESARVPLFIKYPNAIPAGRIVSEPVNHIDVFSTILDYAGATASDRSNGVSLRRYVDGEWINYLRDDSAAFSEWDFREPTASSSLSRTLDSRPNFMVRHGSFKLMMHKKADSSKTDVMFDLANDPSETFNLINKNLGQPSNILIGKAEHLRHLLLEWMDRIQTGRVLNKDYSDPEFNDGEGEGDIAEIFKRQSWPATDIWVGSNLLNFGQPTRVGCLFVRSEWIYIGRRNPGTLNISKISIIGSHAAFFTLSTTEATIQSMKYITIRVTFQSEVDPRLMGRILAKIRIENDAGPALSVHLRYPAYDGDVNVNNPLVCQSVPEASPSTGGVSGFGCFPGDASVQVKGNRTVLMKDLVLGDLILVQGGGYEPVYSFGHLNKEATGEYLQLITTTSSVELSEHHLVFDAERRRFVPASKVKIGDKLELAVGGFDVVQSIRSTSREGIYAPFTLSGTLVVNGIVSSCYISWQHGSARLLIGSVDTGLTYQSLSHAFEAPHRLWCRYASNCSDERYTEHGISTRLAFSHKATVWFFQQHALLKAVLLLPLFALCGMTSCLLVWITVALILRFRIVLRTTHAPTS